jgi:ectoine hydroxylase-related dioxygenase (phytanoyl-CoA dioxygenase family)
MNYHDKGYLLKKQFFDENEQKLWETGASYLKEIPEIVNGPMKYFEKSQINESIILNRVEKFCEYVLLLNDLIRGDKIKSLLKEATGRNYRLFKEKINYKLSGGGGFKPHQDGAAFKKFVDDELITIMIPIHFSDEKNGCFRISNQKYIKKLLPHTNGSIELDEYTIVNNMNWQNINMAPGDLLCFSSYLVHQSNDNLSQLDRSCYFITYSPDDFGDLREAYFAFKREKFPPRIERTSDKDYEQWRKTLSREIL